MSASTMELFEALREGHNVFGTDYTFVRWLGAGGQSVVMLAYDRELQRNVVIKALKDIYNLEASKRFQLEGRVLSGLKHRSIVQVHHTGMFRSGHPFIVMEWIDGETLSAIQKRRHIFPPAEACSLVAQLLDGIDVAHQNGVIHRDIKPGNVFITAEDGTVKLLDFGIAKLIDDHRSMLKAGPLTTAGQVLGTYTFMSPEIAQAHVPDTSADLYSVGVLLFYMLTGRPPFVGDQWEICQHHINSPPPRLSEINRDVTFSPELEGLVAQLLKKNPKERPRRAAEAADILRNIARRIQTSVHVSLDQLQSEEPTVAVADARRVFDAPTRVDDANAKTEVMPAVTPAEVREEAHTATDRAAHPLPAASPPPQPSAVAPAFALAPSPAVQTHKRKRHAVGALWAAAILIGIAGTLSAPALGRIFFRPTTTEPSTVSSPTANETVHVTASATRNPEVVATLPPHVEAPPTSAAPMGTIASSLQKSGNGKTSPMPTAKVSTALSVVTAKPSSKPTGDIFGGALDGRK